MKRSPITSNVPLKRGKALKPRSSKNKYRHRSNERITEWRPCQVCMMLNGGVEELSRPAVATHEVFYNGSAYMRDMSFDYGAQVEACQEHHDLLHKEKEGPIATMLHIYHQERIMYEYEIDHWQFKEIFKKNYLEVVPSPEKNGKTFLKQK